MVVGSCSFNASHRRSTGLFQQWWWAIIFSMLLIEDQLNYFNRRSIVLLEDQLYYWEIDWVVGRLRVLSEDQLYWRQSTGTDENYWSRKLTARWGLHKDVAAECGASSFTWWHSGVILISNMQYRCSSVHPSLRLLHPFHHVRAIWSSKIYLPLTEVMLMQKV